MNERDTLRPRPDPPRGVLRVRAPAQRWSHQRFLPPDLAPFVEHFWSVRWDLDGEHSAETLPHPTLHLVLCDGRAELVGVQRGRFTTALAGRGRVLGTKFRPGTFRAFVDRPAAVWSDRRWPAVEVFGERAASLSTQALAAQALESEGDAATIAVVEAFLRSLAPRLTPAMALAARLVEEAAADRSIVRVEQLAARGGLSPRGLQRLFRGCVGAPPKWVIQRYRLIEAAERLAADPDADGAGLALDLGYADQAHFVRDFKRLLGRPPGAYARGLR